MPGFKLISSDIRTLTYELAVKFRDMAGSPTERPLDPKRVTHLRDKVEKGFAVPFSWATAKLGDKVYRVNGQHSSHMLAALNGTFPDGLKVHMDEYEVVDKDGLVDIFRQYDDRKSGRSAGDVAGAFQNVTDEMAGIDRGIAKLVVESVVWWRHNVEALPVPPGDGIYAAFANTDVQEFVKTTTKILSMKTPEMKRQPVIAALYATQRVNPAEAQTFWEGVARGGDETNDTDPMLVLDNWLRRAKEDANLKEKLKPAHFYQGCIFAWNAWREDKAIKDIRYDTKKGFHTPTA